MGLTPVTKLNEETDHRRAHPSIGVTVAVALVDPRVASVAVVVSFGVTVAGVVAVVIAVRRIYV